MVKLSGKGELSPEAVHVSTPIHGSFSISVTESGRTQVTFDGAWPSEGWPEIASDTFPLRFSMIGTSEEGDNVAFAGALLDEVHGSGAGVSFKLSCTSLSTETCAKHLYPEPDSFTYLLANLHFMGEERILPFTRERSWDFASVDVDGYHLEFTLLPDYVQKTQKMVEAQGSGGTALLTVTKETQPLAVGIVDTIIDDVCMLLSLATKNTIAWIRCEARNVQDVLWTTYRAPRLHPYRDGWELIPRKKFVFLRLTLREYLRLQRPGGIREAIYLMLDAEYHDVLSIKYLLTFVAVERLRATLLTSESALPLLNTSFSKDIDGQLGNQLLQTIRNYAGGLTSDAENLLKLRLRELNRPSITTSVEALCNRYRIHGFQKQMVRLRNVFVHSGALGEFTSEQTLELYTQLSHVLDLVLLKALGYEGDYMHAATGWRIALVSSR